MPPLDLYARVRFLMHSLHTRPRVRRAPGFPCILRLEGDGNFEQASGETRREIAKSYLLFGRSSFVVPANARTHTPQPIGETPVLDTFCDNRRPGLWVPASQGRRLVIRHSIPHARQS